MEEIADKVAASPHAAGAHSLDMTSLFARHEHDAYELYARHGNEQLVRMLKMVGYDVGFCRGEGQYLFDRDGTRYRSFGRFRRLCHRAKSSRCPRCAQERSREQFAEPDPTGCAKACGYTGRAPIKEVPFLDKVLFANSGGEAVEAAMKFARRTTGRSVIVFCDHAFHGVSYGALSINGDESFRRGFAPFVPDCVRIPFNDLAALESELIGSDVAAYIVEPIQRV